MAFMEMCLEKLLERWLLDKNLDFEHIKVCRKNKDLKHGDFVVPKGVLKVDLDTFKRLDLEGKTREATAHETLPVASVSSDDHSAVIFFVDRTKAFGNIVEEVLSRGNKYGHRKEKNQSVVVNPVDLNLHNISANNQSCISTTHLRAVVLLKHVLMLLTANGYKAEMSKFSTTSNVEDLLNTLGVERQEEVPPVTERDWQPLVEAAKVCEWREEVETTKDPDGSEGDNPAAAAALQAMEPVMLNIRKFVNSKHLPTGKNGYDKNLHIVDVIRGNGAAAKALIEAAFICRLVPHDCGEMVCSATYCINLVSQTLAFSQQQADLLLRACFPSHQSLNQKHLVFGVVSSRRSSSRVVTDAKEFYNLRYNQMTQAAMMKYGDHEQGPGWQDMIDGLTIAGITFEMLATSCSRVVHLDLAEDDIEKGIDNRSGPFVLYNCARLATLLQSFQERVEQGIYPELPDASQIDFSVLREEEEWSIAFMYLNAFPLLVQDSGGDWPENEAINVSLSTHRVAHFLLSFAKTLSCYYSRYHILGGSEEHLLPLMFARLSLMKASYQVLCNGLYLLGLQPFSQL